MCDSEEISKQHVACDVCSLHRGPLQAVRMYSGGLNYRLLSTLAFFPFIALVQATNHTNTGGSSGTPNDGGIMAVITISVLVIAFFIAIGTAKLTGYLHARKTIRDDASDISEYTRDILKTQFLQAFHKGMKKKKEKPEEIAKRYAKMWRAKVARNIARRRKSGEAMAEEGKVNQLSPIHAAKKEKTNKIIVTPAIIKEETEDSVKLTKDKDKKGPLPASKAKGTEASPTDTKPTAPAAKPTPAQTKDNTPKQTQGDNKNPPKQTQGDNTPTDNKDAKTKISEDKTADGKPTVAMLGKKASVTAVDYTDELMMPVAVSPLSAKRDSLTSLSSRGDYEFLATESKDSSGTPPQHSKRPTNVVVDKPEGNLTPHSLSAVKLENKDSPRAKANQPSTQVTKKPLTETAGAKPSSSGGGRAASSRPSTARSSSGRRPITPGARRPVSAKAITPSGAKVTIKVTPKS